MIFLSVSQNKVVDLSDVSSFRKFTGDIYSLQQLYKGDDNRIRPCNEHGDINLSFWRDEPAYVVDSMPRRSLPDRYFDDVRNK